MTPLTDHEAQLAWVEDSVRRLGRTITGPLVREHVRPWSTAGRVPTDGGVLWFKAHTPVLAREAPVTRLLAALRPGLVLDVVASDDDRCWLLTRDAGDKLRARIATRRDLDLLEPVLSAYGDLQRAAAPRADELLALGALDRRGRRLAGLLAEGLADGAGLSTDERRRLERCVPAVAALAEAASAQLDDTIDHGDLHDGNLFADGRRVTVADFGDCAVGPPFVSLVVLERSLAFRLSVDPDGAAMRRLRRAYLEPWTDLAPITQLEQLAMDVRPLGLLSRALTWRALAVGVDDPGMDEFADGWPEYLRELLAAVAATSVAGRR